MEGFRPFWSGVNFLVSQWILIGSKLGSKSIFQREWIWFINPNIHSVSQPLIMKRSRLLNSTLCELSNGIKNSKIGRIDQKLWPFQVSAVGPNGPIHSLSEQKLSWNALFSEVYSPYLKPLRTRHKVGPKWAFKVLTKPLIHQIIFYINSLQEPIFTLSI